MDFLLLGWLLGNCQFSLTRKKRSRFGDFSTRTHIVGHQDSAGPIWVVCVFIALTIVVLICPSGLQVPDYFAM